MRRSATNIGTLPSRGLFARFRKPLVILAILGLLAYLIYSFVFLDKLQHRDNSLASDVIHRKFDHDKLNQKEAARQQEFKELQNEVPAEVERYLPRQGNFDNLQNHDNFESSNEGNDHDNKKHDESNPSHFPDFSQLHDEKGHPVHDDKAVSDWQQYERIKNAELAKIEQQKAAKQHQDHHDNRDYLQDLKTADQIKKLDVPDTLKSKLLEDHMKKQKNFKQKPESGSSLNDYIAQIEEENANKQHDGPSSKHGSSNMDLSTLRERSASKKFAAPQKVYDEKINDDEDDDEDPYELHSSTAASSSAGSASKEATRISSMEKTSAPLAPKKLEQDKNVDSFELAADKKKEQATTFEKVTAVEKKSESQEDKNKNKNKMPEPQLSSPVSHNILPQASKGKARAAEEEEERGRFFKFVVAEKEKQVDKSSTLKKLEEQKSNAVKPSLLEQEEEEEEGGYGAHVEQKLQGAAAKKTSVKEAPKQQAIEDFSKKTTASVKTPEKVSKDNGDSSLESHPFVTRKDVEKGAKKSAPQEEKKMVEPQQQQQHVEEENKRSSSSSADKKSSSLESRNSIKNVEDHPFIKPRKQQEEKKKELNPFLVDPFEQQKEQKGDENSFFTSKAATVAKEEEEVVKSAAKKDAIVVTSAPAKTVTAAAAATIAKTPATTAATIAKTPATAAATATDKKENTIGTVSSSAATTPTTTTNIKKDEDKKKMDDLAAKVADNKKTAEQNSKSIAKSEESFEEVKLSPLNKKKSNKKKKPLRNSKKNKKTTRGKKNSKKTKYGKKKKKSDEWY